MKRRDVTARLSPSAETADMAQHAPAPCPRAPHIPWLNDEFCGQGGDYIFDPVTRTRTRRPAGEVTTATAGTADQPTQE